MYLIGRNGDSLVGDPLSHLEYGREGVMRSVASIALGIPVAGLFLLLKTYHCLICTSLQLVWSSRNFLYQKILLLRRELGIFISTSSHIASLVCLFIFSFLLM